MDPKLSSQLISSDQVCVYVCVCVCVWEGGTDGVCVCEGRRGTGSVCVCVCVGGGQMVALAVLLCTHTQCLLVDQMWDSVDYQLFCFCFIVVDYGTR